MEENVRMTGMDFNQTRYGVNNLGKSNEFSHQEMKANVMYNSHGDVGINM